MRQLSADLGGRARGPWGGVVSLGLGVFSIAMSQFMPTSLLPLMAGGLGISMGAAGQSLTATAAAAMLSALLVPVLLPRTDRRRVMIGLTIFAVAGNLLTAFAPELVTLLAARVLLGIALGGFWTMAVAVTAHLVPAGHLGRALALVNVGVSLATGAAVPLGAWLGDMWGWRPVFVVAGAAAAIACLMQAVTLPAVPPGRTTGGRALAAALRSRIVQFGLVATLLIYIGHFVGYTYFRPIVEQLSDVDAAGVGALLLAFGLASFVGTALAGPLADKARRTGALLYPSVLGIGMLLFIMVADTGLGAFAAMVLWGFGFGGMATSLQAWGARVEPDRLEQMGGLLVMVANTAVAGGAVGGGFLIDSVPSAVLLAAGGATAICGGLLIARLQADRLVPQTA